MKSTDWLFNMAVSAWQFGETFLTSKPKGAIKQIQTSAFCSLWKEFFSFWFISTLVFYLCKFSSNYKNLTNLIITLAFFSVTFKETHLEIPMPILALKKFGPDISWKYKVMAKVADFLLMRRTLFEHLEYRGVRTYLWVLNEPEDFDRGT